jgi:hypothetical protein
MVAPIIFIFDDMQNYDMYCFKFIKKIMEFKFQDVFIVASIRTDYIETPLFVNNNIPSQE